MEQMLLKSNVQRYHTAAITKLTVSIVLQFGLSFQTDILKTFYDWLSVLELQFD